MSQKLETRITRTLSTIALVASIAFPLFLHRLSAAQTVTEHPYIAEIKTETCLGCHPDKKEGKFVHTAVGSGCESCHRATSDKGKERTTITLKAEGGELCAMCHEFHKDVAVHKPCQLGQCLVCHDPHTSNFARQVRTETNGLCLACHGENQKDMKVDKDAQTVTMLGSRTIPLDEYVQAPKIPLDRSGTHGHPTMNHPVSGSNVKGKEGTLSCLSCHAPHGTPEEKRKRPATKSEIGICGACHE